MTAQRAAPRGRATRSVTSRDNPAVLETRRLERDRAERDRLGVYLAWGTHLAGEALASGTRVVRAFLGPEESAGAEARALMRRIESSGAPIVRVTPRVLDAIAPGAGDQSVLLVLRRTRAALASTLESGATLLVAAHGVQDPGNLGSIVRSTLASGAAALLTLEGCADPYSSKVVRAAMGAHGRLPVIAARSSEALGSLRRGGFRLIAAHAGGTRRPSSVDLTRRTVLLLGSEGAGLPDSILDAADERIRIPMSPASSSLNVAAAAAILLYEIQRQRDFPGQA